MQRRNFCGLEINEDDKDKKNSKIKKGFKILKTYKAFKAMKEIKEKEIKSSKNVEKFKDFKNRKIQQFKELRNIRNFKDIKNLKKYEVKEDDRQAKWYNIIYLKKQIMTYGIKGAILYGLFNVTSFLILYLLISNEVIPSILRFNFILFYFFYLI